MSQLRSNISRFSDISAKLATLTVYQDWKQFCKPGITEWQQSHSHRQSGIWVRTCDTELVRFRELDLRRHDTD